MEYKHLEAVRSIKGNQSLMLNDPQTIWVIQAGAMAVFAVVAHQGIPGGTRRYLFSCQAGEAMFAPPDGEDAPLGMVAVSLEATMLVAISRDELAQGLAIADESAIALLKTWFNHLQQLDIPYTPCATPHNLATLDHCHTHLLAHLTTVSVQEQTDELQRLQTREAFDRQMTMDVIADLALLLNRNINLETGILADQEGVALAYLPLYQATRAVGRALGVTMQMPAKPEYFQQVKLPVEAIARASRLRMRQVLLSDRWWRKDCGPLLGFRGEDKQPVALLPVASHRYAIFDPMQGTRTPVNRQTDATLSPVAYTFYRPLPAQARQVMDLCRFGLQGTRRDWLVVVWAGVAASLLGMFIPQAIALLIDQAIPNANRGLLTQIGFGLLAATIGGVLFELTQGFALVRLEALIESSTQVALWDRLLTLGVPFFRQFAVGDLRARVAVVNAIRRQVSGVTMRTLFSSAFALLNLGLLFYYSWQLALLAVAIAVVVSAIAMISGQITLRLSLSLQDVEGTLFGLMVQLMNGVAKLRVAGAEERAFAYWGKQYRQQQRLKLKLQELTDTRTVWHQVLPIIGTALLFAIASSLLQSSTQSTLTIGAFLAFNVAFGSFMGGIQLFSNTAVQVLAAFALSQRAVPLLAAKPEIELGKSDPGELSGRLGVDRVVFRYRPDGPLILDQVSLYAEPGEFIAIVGPSGSGKSTLFRLLLGFDRPTSGLVAYDGQDLRDLDIHSVRRQLGVLLQTSQTTTASIFENIAGSTPISMDDAWEAANQAGLADDIAHMPMGMHTMISEGGSNLSGGQRQRLLIARALALKPRILLFDEATSFLDNRTQAIVSDSLTRLQITRIVIAHRLSTIKTADRIYVLQSGRIVQQGQFEELLQQDGLFRRLMQRQML